METIHLKVNPKVYDHVMWLLKQFDRNDVEIVSEEFLKNKAELEEVLRLSDSGQLTYYTVDEVEKMTSEKFLTEKAELDENLRKIDSGEATFISLEEFEKETEELLKRYEG
ncbi:hypothetical protein ACLI09_11505 [Flavobacterium sp. RHBU_24]|uniref:hypothetical protein n=1 Tax=Flavobacterium sp. RHBU_24 TaxID=3391185 RepID=UPI00398536E5